MRILFVHKFNYFEPLGMMWLSAFLKEQGTQCEFLDLKFDRDFLRTVNKIKPDILAYSATTNNWQYYQGVNREIRRHHRAVSVFGGPHATFFPEMILEEGVDVICRGEGELAFAELAGALQDGKDITQISNLWVKAGGEIYKNDLRPLIEDLDSLPFPDRDLVDKYHHYRKRSRVRTMASRGCPYHCSYCFNHAYNELYRGKGNLLRRRSPENVVSEVEQLKLRYLPRNIEFHDDVFILDKRWTAAFLELYRAKNIRLPFEINVRPELVDRELVDMLKSSGCYSVQFGIETGSPELRKKILCRNTSDAQILEAARLFRKAGIKINTYNMIGIPQETLADSFKTLYLNRRCKPDYAMNTIFHPYPGSLIAKTAVNEGVFAGEYRNYGRNLFYGRSVLHLKDMKKMIRLHYLFALGVRVPALVPLIRLLVSLPFGKLYQPLYFLYRAWAIIVIFKRLTIKEIFLRK